MKFNTSPSAASIFATVLFLSASCMQASTVAFSTSPFARVLANEVGVNFTAANQGSVWIGTFSSPGSFTANNSLSVAANIAAITTAGGWEQFTVDTATDAQNAGATSTIDFSPTSSLARLGGQAVDTTTGGTKADFFNGKQVYVWIFNSDTPSSATEMGIFTSTAWVYPVNGSVGDSVSLGTTTATTITDVGGVGSVFTGGTTATNQLRTEAFGSGPVPEPSRIILLGLGAVGLVFRRRRA